MIKSQASTADAWRAMRKRSPRPASRVRASGRKVVVDGQHLARSISSE